MGKYLRGTPDQPCTFRPLHRCTCCQVCYYHHFIKIQVYKHGNTAVTIYVTIRELCGLTFWGRNYFFFILAHPVYKMLIIQEPNMLEL